MIEGIIKVKDSAVIWENKLDTLINSIAHNPENEGKSFEVSVKPISNRSGHYLHKYYRGFLIPAIAEEAYSGDEDEAHLQMKIKFLMYTAESFKDIPLKHKSYAQPLAFPNVCANVQGAFVVFPSTSCLSNEEFRDYIKKIEELSLEYMQLNLSKNALEARQKGMELNKTNNVKKI